MKLNRAQSIAHFRNSTSKLWGKLTWLLLKQSAILIVPASTQNIIDLNKLPLTFKHQPFKQSFSFSLSMFEEEPNAIE